jgi:hypothetical protein
MGEATTIGVVRELISGLEWFGYIRVESADTETSFGIQHTDVVTVYSDSQRKHFPFTAVSIEPCEECPATATAL